MEWMHCRSVCSEFGLVAVILAAFFGGKAAGNILYILGWAAIIYCYFRIFSKNITKRYAENQKYLAKTYKLRSFFYKQKELMKQRKVYHIINVRVVSRKSVFHVEKERLK